MNTETALTILIGRSELAPFSATGRGSANQRVRGIVDGHVIEVNRRGKQVLISIDGSSKLIDRDTAYDVLTGAVDYDVVTAQYFQDA